MVKAPKNPSISCAHHHSSSSTRLHDYSSSSSSSTRLNNLHNTHDITNKSSTKTKRKRTSQRVRKRRKVKREKMLAKDDNKLINIVNNQCTNIKHSFKQHAIKHCQTKHNCAADSTKPV